MAKKKTSSKSKQPTERTLIKYRLIIDEWFNNDFHGAKAYKRFHPKASDQTAEVNFSRLKNIPAIQDYIAKVESDIAERNKVSIDECVTYLAKMMRFDVKDLFHDDGTVKDIKDIPEDARTAIESFEVDEVTLGGQTIGTTKKIKLSSRRANIIELMKHLGGYEKDNSQKESNNVVIFNIPDNGRG